MATNEASLSRGAKLLAAWLKRNAVGHNELGRRLGFKSDFVTKLVHGQRNPGLEAALIIEDKCGIPARAWITTPRRIAA